MSSSVYHRSSLLDRSTDSSQIIDPWLDDKTTTPYRRGPARSSMPPANATQTRRLQPKAARNLPRTAAKMPALQAPSLAVSSVRHATTMKIERVARPAQTADQRSHLALESYWRDQRRAQRARTARRLWLGAALGSALLAAVMLRLFGLDLLESFSWQAAPKVNLADLITRGHETPTAPAQSAASGVQPSSVTVTAPESDALNQPATLHIDSQPWARVFVDDVLIGNTPQLAIRLAPGTHTLRFHNPERSLLKNITIDVHPGETIHRVEQLER